MNELTVLYPLWEMECCGEPFKLGEKISWVITNSYNEEVLNIEEKIDYLYSAHNTYLKKDELFDLTGIVDELKMIYFKYKEENKILYPTEFKKINLNTSDEFIRKIGEFEADAYVVKIIQPIISPTD